jgi:hypothetical protein
MMEAVSRAVMRLAIHCLGDQRRDWARAMQAEFQIAAEDGQPLAFAIGCLVGALREMPGQHEGRFVIANHVLAIGLILPTAVMMLSSMISSFGYSGAQDLLPIGSGAEPLLSAGNRSAVPSLAIILILLAGAHLRIAWALLECDWARVADTSRMIAALTVTLTVFSGLVFVSSRGLTLAVVAAMELTGILIVARWHAQLRLRSALSL